MTDLTEAAGRVIAGDMVSAFAATDRALEASLKASASMLEGTHASQLDPRTKQKLLETLHGGATQLIAGRRAMTQAHAQMVVIVRKSNLAEVDFGCWGGPRNDDDGDEGFFTSGALTRSFTAA